MSSSTKFIQVATLEYLLKKEAWTADDRVYILMTQEAHNLNWDVTKRPKSKYNSDSIEYIEYSGLKKDLDNLDNLHFQAEVKPVIIKEGKDEKELWEIFETVYGLIKDGEKDCLYFDLTHGFRYLPMLVIVLGNYAKFLNNDEVKSITYGNFEANNTLIKPLMDLLPISSLQDWTFAAASFVKNGNIQQLTKLGLSHTGLLLRQYNKEGNKEGKEDVESLKYFINAATRMVNSMIFCRSLSILEGKDCCQLRRYARKSKRDVIKPLSPIIDKIVASTSDFHSQEDIWNCFAAAKWCKENGHYQQAITILQESIVTFFCRKYRLDIKDKDKRAFVNSAFRKKNEPETYVPSDNIEGERYVDSILWDALLQNKTLVKDFAILSDYRNDFNHAGARKDSMEPRVLAQKIDILIDDVCGIFSSVFLNLSNHPSSEWDEKQRKAAEAYGEIEDMPFPQVDPDADEKKIEELAERITEEILEKAETHSITVHIMGEMCLTFAVVSRLTTHGIRCVSSTTERVCETLPDGSKRTEFHFARFREYGC